MDVQAGDGADAAHAQGADVVGGGVPRVDVAFRRHAFAHCWKKGRKKYSLLKRTVSYPFLEGGSVCQSVCLSHRLRISKRHAFSLYMKEEEEK